MEVQKDFKGLLGLLSARSVDYVVIGIYAMARHGAPRFTGDMDILVRADSENGQRVLDALADFGFGSVGLELRDFAVPDRVVQLGYPPVRVDILTSIDGVSWPEIAAGCVPVTTATFQFASLAGRSSS